MMRSVRHIIITQCRVLLSELGGSEKLFRESDKEDDTCLIY